MRIKLILITLLTCLAPAQGESLYAQGTAVFRNEKGVVTELHHSGPAKQPIPRENAASNWSDFKELEIVTISHSPITRKLMKSVGAIESLRILELGLESTNLGKVERGSLGPIGQLKQLKEFTLSHYYDDLTDDDFGFLTKLSSLERFCTYNNVSKSTFEKISHLKNLTHLSCWDISGRSEDIRQFAKNEKLQSLSLGSISDPSSLLEGLSGNGIRKLSFTCKELKKNDIDLLASLEELEVLDINAHFEIPPLTALASLAKLKRLGLFMEGTGKRLDLKPLRSLRDLRSISIISRSKNDKIYIEGMKGHEKLESLYLNSNFTIADQHLSTLKSWSSMRAVAVQSSEIEIGILKRQIPNCEIVLLGQE